jgi:hypothetical protein
MSYYLLHRLWLVRYLLLTSNIGSFKVENWPEMAKKIKLRVVAVVRIVGAPV